MMIFKTIDGLFIGTRYGSWGLGVIGILCSLILVVANVSLGIPSAMLFVAALCLSIAVSLILLPKQLVKNDFLKDKRFVIGGLAIVVAALIAGIVFLTNGGFPPVNLLFV